MSVVLFESRPNADEVSWVMGWIICRCLQPTENARFSVLT